MHCCVLFASPRGGLSNTRALLMEFLAEWHDAGHSFVIHSLYDEAITPCMACRGCQYDWSEPGCVIDDDMTGIFEEILHCDLLLLASPIYNWFCTAPLKAAMDRCIYALCKYYGDEKGPSLWEGTAVAALTTCGYRVEKGADVWEEGLRRTCKHARLRYLGLHGERHTGYNVPFMDEGKAARTRQFAREVMDRLSVEVGRDWP